MSDGILSAAATPEVAGGDYAAAAAAVARSREPEGPRSRRLQFGEEVAATGLSKGGGAPAAAERSPLRSAVFLAIAAALLLALYLLAARAMRGSNRRLPFVV